MPRIFKKKRRRFDEIWSLSFVHVQGGLGGTWGDNKSRPSTKPVKQSSKIHILYLPSKLRDSSDTFAKYGSSGAAAHDLRDFDRCSSMFECFGSGSKPRNFWLGRRLSRIETVWVRI